MVCLAVKVAGSVWPRIKGLLERAERTGNGAAVREVQNEKDGRGRK